MMTSAVTWFVLGIIFIVMEVTVATGVGLLFAGLGAIMLGGLVTYKFIVLDNPIQALAYFFLFTIMWWGILWKSLKKASKRSRDSYKNLAGTEGQINDENGIEAGRVGNIKWSGSIVRARIVPESETQKIDFGTTVFVHGQKDGIFLIDIK